MKYVLLTLLLIGCETLEFNAGSLKIDFVGPETAHVYKHKKTRELLYCSNKQGNDPQDFIYKGTAEVPPNDIKFCALN